LKALLWLKKAISFKTQEVSAVLGNALRHYIRKIEHLRVDRAHGIAPHKPLLLLSVIELIEQGQLVENKIEPSPDLAAIFIKYWSKVTTRKNPNMSLPFFHLKSDSFWHLHAQPGFEEALRTASQIRTVSRLREVVANASLDEELFALLSHPQYREMIRQAIIRCYFPDKKGQIEKIIEDSKKVHESQLLLIREAEEPFLAYKPAKIKETETPIRSAAFRQTIMSLYDYTCSICRLRIVTMDGESAVDAAHIIPFSISHNDDVRNGISLCKLHHWAFDRGLVSLSPSYQVLVSPLMDERRPTEWLLTELREKSILLPEKKLFYPSEEALEWHRKTAFQK